MQSALNELVINIIHLFYHLSTEQARLWTLFIVAWMVLALVIDVFLNDNSRMLFSNGRGNTLENCIDLCADQCVLSFRISGNWQTALIRPQTPMRHNPW